MPLATICLSNSIRLIVASMAPQAVHRFASTMVAIPAHLRPAHAQDLRQLAMAAQGALSQVPGPVRPWFRGLGSELEEVVRLATSVVEWYDQLAILPREMCDPEPELFWLQEMNVTSLVHMPDYTATNMTITSDIHQFLLQQDLWTRAHLVVVIMQPAASAILDFANAVQLTALSHLGQALEDMLTSIDLGVP